ncbi:MAG: septal ring lytic transglycosylase RlpA family protein, partial [Candidatus Saccharicenans sp.]
CRPPSPATAPKSGYVETGIASWYGEEFHGRKTSSREIFDQNDLTAAHKNLPFGTLVLVTNLDNGRQVTVKINDRGPFVKDRIIDLSYAAARMLEMVGPGTARVRIEVIGFKPTETDQEMAKKNFILQVGSFVNSENARSLYLNLQKEFPSVFISPYQSGNQVFYRVRLKAGSEKEARQLAENLVKAGYPVLLLRE